MSRLVHHVVALAGAMTVGASPVFAQAGVSVVDTQMSVYLAGGNTYSVAPSGGGGIAPTAILLDPGTGRVLTVAATGTATFCGGGTCGTPSPDGPAISNTNLPSSGAISGIVAPSSGFLAAVFLGPALPGSAPASLDFNALTLNFLTLAPALGQVFFVGDGFAGATQQQFLVPDGATRLFFGIADGFAFNQGPPGHYADNVGVYDVSFNVTSQQVVPEPATVALLGSGLAGLALLRRRRMTG